MKVKKLICNTLVLLSILGSLLISLSLLYNMGVFADEQFVSIADIYGGPFRLYMDWLRLFLLGFGVLAGVIDAISGAKCNGFLAWVTLAVAVLALIISLVLHFRITAYVAESGATLTRICGGKLTADLYFVRMYLLGLGSLAGILRLLPLGRKKEK